MVGGTHYHHGNNTGEQHWDRVARLGLDYFQGQITKYVERWKLKNGIQDLLKARHFLDKYIELEEAKSVNREYEQQKSYPTLFGDTNTVAAHMGTEHKHDGWIGYTYEGGNADYEFYRCKQCHEHFRIPVHANPNEHHTTHQTKEQQHDRQAHASSA